MVKEKGEKKREIKVEYIFIFWKEKHNKCVGEKGKGNNIDSA